MADSCTSPPPDVHWGPLCTDTQVEELPPSLALKAALLVSVEQSLPDIVKSVSDSVLETAAEAVTAHDPTQKEKACHKDSLLALAESDESQLSEYHAAVYRRIHNSLQEMNEDQIQESKMKLAQKHQDMRKTTETKSLEAAGRTADVFQTVLTSLPPDPVTMHQGKFDNFETATLKEAREALQRLRGRNHAGEVPFQGAHLDQPDVPDTRYNVGLSAGMVLGATQLWQRVESLDPVDGMKSDAKHRPVCTVNVPTLVNEFLYYKCDWKNLPCKLQKRDDVQAIPAFFEDKLRAASHQILEVRELEAQCAEFKGDLQVCRTLRTSSMAAKEVTEQYIKELQQARDTCQNAQKDFMEEHIQKKSQCLQGISEKYIRFLELQKKCNEEWAAIQDEESELVTIQHSIALREEVHKCTEELFSTKMQQALVVTQAHADEVALVEGCQQAKDAIIDESLNKLKASSAALQGYVTAKHLENYETHVVLANFMESQVAVAGEVVDASRKSLRDHMEAKAALEAQRPAELDLPEGRRTEYGKKAIRKYEADKLVWSQKEKDLQEGLEYNERESCIWVAKSEELHRHFLATKSLEAVKAQSEHNHTAVTDPFMEDSMVNLRRKCNTTANALLNLLEGAKKDFAAFYDSIVDGVGDKQAALGKLHETLANLKQFTAPEMTEKTEIWSRMGTYLLYQNKRLSDDIQETQKKLSSDIEKYGTDIKIPPSVACLWYDVQTRLEPMINDAAQSSEQQSEAYRPDDDVVSICSADSLFH
jgi:hypothetical protein